MPINVAYSQHGFNSPPMIQHEPHHSHHDQQQQRPYSVGMSSGGMPSPQGGPQLSPSTSSTSPLGGTNFNPQSPFSLDPDSPPPAYSPTTSLDSNPSLSAPNNAQQQQQEVNNGQQQQQQQQNGQAMEQMDTGMGNPTTTAVPYVVR